MRAIWKGSISFGLVNIPIRLYSASEERELKFILLHTKDMSQIRYAKICKSEDKEIPWEEIGKGYEYEEGNYVILKDEDFQKANLEKSKTIEILNFVEEQEVDSTYYDHPYYLEPEKNSSKAYALLCEALNKSNKVAIAKYILRNKEHMAIIKPKKNLLILNQLRYDNEIKKPKDLNIPENQKISTKELEIALQLIDQLTVPFHAEKYKDEYTEELKKIIKQKAKGKPIHPKSEPAPKTKVHDIMSLLEASLERNKKKSRSKSA